MAYTTIDDPEAYFQAKTYSGNGSTQSITLDADTDMQPDLVWIKAKAGDNISNWRSVDSVRGATIELFQDSNVAEETNTNGLTAFNSDGFSLGNSAGTNEGGTTYGAWCWKESATAGFDIDASAGTGSARTEAHSLSAVPNFIIIKNRDAADSWQVYHSANTAAPETDYLVLNDGAAATQDAADRWNDAAPTSSVFSLGDGDEVNTNTENYIAYLWRSVQGFSKFSSYTGNGNADGPFIYLGFKPAFFLVRRSDVSNFWGLFDNKRSPHNLVEDRLWLNENSAESDGQEVDFLSNGIKIRATNSYWNTSGGTYIYMAFAEAPFVNSNGVPCNAR